MSTQFRAVLDGLDEASSCSGEHRLGERLALALPDGDVGAVDDKGFVDWLLAHAEPAPYGHGTTTKVDPKVRAAQRLTARGKVDVHGFDPAAVLDQIEVAMSPSVHLAAHLTDVIVYGKGGKFSKHKDTPRSPELIGTLIVGLPIAHTGGAFVVDDGREKREFDWSKPARGVVPWVALFSDVDHEIKPVKSGTRVTLVYALHRTDRPRTDRGATTRRATLLAAARTLDAPPRWPLMIACGRQVIAEPDVPQPQKLETLRGADRDIADALVAAGYKVAVRACIAAVADYNNPTRGPFPDLTNLFAVTRLKSVPPPSVIEHMGEEGMAGDMEDYTHDSISLEQWIIRKNAAATMIHENAQWSETGSFGNEGYDALLYTLAALEVTRAKRPAAKAKPVAKQKPATAKKKTKKTKTKTKR